jgi:hypothetical protein
MENMLGTLVPVYHGSRMGDVLVRERLKFTVGRYSGES